MKVFCFVRDAQGSPDFTQHVVDVSRDEIEQGLHYVLAKQLARDEGYEVIETFDEEDPAFRWLAEVK